MAYVAGGLVHTSAPSRAPDDKGRERAAGTRGQSLQTAGPAMPQAYRTQPRTRLRLADASPSRLIVRSSTVWVRLCRALGHSPLLGSEHRLIHALDRIGRAHVDPGARVPRVLVVVRATSPDVMLRNVLGHCVPFGGLAHLHTVSVLATR